MVRWLNEFVEVLKVGLILGLILGLIINDIAFILLLFVVSDDFHLPVWGWGMFFLFMVSLYLLFKNIEEEVENEGRERDK